MAFCLCGPAEGVFEPVRQAQPRLQKQPQPKKKKVRRASVKKPDTRALQAQAEADMKHHENDARLRQFQQMQQAQQRAYRQRMQSQQGAQAADQ